MTDQAADFSLWAYLSASPLLWLTVTLVAWLIADRIAVLCHRHPIVNPVAISVLIIALLLTATKTPYGVYFEGAQFVHFLLGPATVALAVPLYRTRALVMARLVPVLVALVIGSATAIVVSMGCGILFGASHDTIIALAPKSVTTPIAMGITKQLGGEPALTAVFVIITGILGGVIVTPLMNALKIRDYAARGFAAGLAAHGVGTARAFAVDHTAGTFAGIAMALNALMTTLIVPVVFGWVMSFAH